MFVEGGGRVRVVGVAERAAEARARGSGFHLCWGLAVVSWLMDHGGGLDSLSGGGSCLARMTSGAAVGLLLHSTWALEASGQYIGFAGEGSGTIATAGSFICRFCLTSCSFNVSLLCAEHGAAVVLCVEHDSLLDVFSI